MARDLVNTDGGLPLFSGAELVKRRGLIFRLPTSNLPGAAPQTTLFMDAFARAGLLVGSTPNVGEVWAGGWVQQPTMGSGILTLPQSVEVGSALTSAFTNDVGTDTVDILAAFGAVPSTVNMRITFIGLGDVGIWTIDGPITTVLIPSFGFINVPGLSGSTLRIQLRPSTGEWSVYKDATLVQSGVSSLPTSPTGTVALTEIFNVGGASAAYELDFLRIERQV